MNGTPEKPLLLYAPIVNHRTGRPLRKPNKPQLNKAWIYGLFSPDSICHYVGETANPGFRRAGHHAHRSRFWKLKVSCQMRILRTCEPQRANRIETQVIAAYKRKGQCQINQTPFLLSKKLAKLKSYSGGLTIGIEHDNVSGIMSPASLIGKTGSYQVRGMELYVVIVGTRLMFGRPEIRIKPAQGTGEVWICSESVNLNQKTQ